MTWHRIQVAREEGEVISEVLAAASAPNRWATSAGNFLYLNAGALSPYRMLGGTKMVDDVSESLPDDVWRTTEKPKGLRRALSFSRRAFTYTHGVAVSDRHISDTASSR
jgi:hypothetical protein